MKFNEPIYQALIAQEKVVIINFLLTHNHSMSEREMAAILKMPHITVNRILKSLADTNLVQYRTVGKSHVWKANKSSYAYRFFSLLIPLIIRNSKPLEDLTKTILKYIPLSLVNKLILFGSIAHKEEKQGSDIDLCIVLKNISAKAKIESFLETLSTVCFNYYDKRLSAYIVTAEEYRKKQQSELLKNIAKGIQIYPKIS